MFDDDDYLLLDVGIRETVRHLNRVGIVTLESCQGGPGHPYPTPWISISGEHGRREVKDAVTQTGNRVLSLRRRRIKMPVQYQDGSRGTLAQQEWHLWLRPWPELGYSLSPVRRVAALWDLLMDLRG